MIKQVMSKKDVRIKNKTTLHQGFCHVERYEMQHRQFDGQWSEFYTREFTKNPLVAAAIPYDPNNDSVVLIEQFRVGAFEHAQNPWLIEIVAGIMDHSCTESLEQLVKREMLEEVGLEPQELLPIYNYLVSPGNATTKIQLFCAKVDSTKAPQYSGMACEHEDIKVHVLPSSDAFAAVHSGQINNALAIIGLQWLELNLEKLKKVSSLDTFPFSASYGKEINIKMSCSSIQQPRVGKTTNRYSKNCTNNNILHF